MSRNSTKEKNLGHHQGSTDETKSSSINSIAAPNDSANQNHETHLVDTQTIAAIIGVEPHWIRRAVVEHGLPCRKYGNAYRFDIYEVLEFGKRAAKTAIDKRKKKGPMSNEKSSKRKEM
jgi:hypothetical protein